MRQKFKTITYLDKTWIDPVSWVKYSVFDVELECGHHIEVKSTGWFSGFGYCNECPPITEELKDGF